MAELLGIVVGHDENRQRASLVFPTLAPQRIRVQHHSQFGKLLAARAEKRHVGFVHDVIHDTNLETRIQDIPDARHERSLFHVTWVKCAHEDDLGPVESWKCIRTPREICVDTNALHRRLGRQEVQEFWYVLAIDHRFAAGYHH